MKLKSWRYVLLSLLSLHTLLATAAESACDNSVIILKNMTDVNFSVTYAPRSDTKLTLLHGPAELVPYGGLSFKVHSGRMSFGESLGVIKIKGYEREYELFYLFGSFFGFGDCTVRSDVTTNRYNFSSEKYNINCQDGVIKNPATLTCTITRPQTQIPDAKAAPAA